MKIFLEKYGKYFCSNKKMCTFALHLQKDGPVAQLNRASDYGSEGYRFESCRDHIKESQICDSFFFLCVYCL